MVLERGSRTARIQRAADTLAQTLNRGFDGGRVVGEVVVNGDAVCRAFDFHAAFDVFKRAQGFAGRLNADTGMTRGGDDGERVHAVVPAHQIPFDASGRFAVEQHVERAVGIGFVNLPAVFRAEFFHQRPAAFVQSILQALLPSVADD